MSPEGDIALITAREIGLVDDDRRLVEALARRGLRAESRVWDDPEADWAAYRMCLIRSTWDYFFRLEEFLAWTRRAAALTRLENNAELVAWNVDKRYLAELASRGVAVIDTAFIDPGTETTLADVLRERGWRNAVVKPAVDGGAKRLFALSDGATPQAEAAFRELLRIGAVLVQPFLNSVVERGELSLFLIDGELTHAALKRPRAGDFRVQPEWGGSAQAIAPQPRDIEAVGALVEAIGPPPLYARVDLVYHEGRALLMELEAIEPRMFLSLAPTAAERFADAILGRLGDWRTSSRQTNNP